MMNSRTSLWLFQAILLCTSIVFAGPGGHLELVNLSPYDWELTYQHSYHMDWHPTDLILAGGKHEQYVEWWYTWGDNGDCGAEATYRLKGTEYEFTVQARQRNGKRLLIEYNDALAAMTMTREKVIELGFDHDGSVLFVLSGDGVEPYVASQAPKNWMQQTLSTIGSKELREISMPMSHNAGMFTVSYKYLGIAHNTVCQTLPIYSQLSFGARWFDLRPAFAHGKWLTAHASKLATGTVAGTTGAEFAGIINDINRFTAEAPGEFIVLEIGHELDAVDSGGVHPLKEGLPPNRWQEFYKLLEGINELWQPKDSNIPHDLTSLAMSGFIQPGSKSAVVIRLPNHAPLPEPGNPAFVHEDRLPWTGDWTQTSDPTILDTEATCRLNAERTCSKSRMFRFPYTITPRVKDMIDIANPLHSIIGESMWAEHKLFQTIWDKLTPNTYPNLIEMDNIHNSQITAISMVINQRYANAPQNKNVKREGSMLRKQLIKLSIEDLKAEEFEKTATPEEREELASIQSSLSAQYTTSLETEYANLTSISNPSTFETQYTNVTNIPDPSTSFSPDLEARARGPPRKNGHLWNTDDHLWATDDHEWNTASRIWCTGNRPWIVQYTEIATVVFEFIGSTQSSASTVTVSAIDMDVDEWYPLPRPAPPQPASVTWVSASSTTFWSTLPKPPPTPTPKPSVMTITVPKEDWDASITPEGFLCTMDW